MENKLDKWAPILDALDVKDLNKREFMSQYAEIYSHMENEVWKMNFEKSIIPTDDCLPFIDKDGEKQNYNARRLGK